MMKNIFKFWILLIVVIGFIYKAEAQSYAGAGMAGFEFLKLNIDARSSGMAGPYVCMVDEINSLPYNPAVMSIINKKTVAGNYNSFIQDINVFNITGSYPFFGIGNFGGSITYLHTGDIPVTGDSPDAIDTASVNNFGVIASYSMRIPKINNSGFFKYINKMPVGVSLKFFTQSIYESSTVGMALDIGAIYEEPIKNLFLGISFLNLGFSGKMEEYSDTLPVTMKFGGMYRFSFYHLNKLSEDMNVYLDITKAYGENLLIGLGVESIFYDIGIIRLGYKILHSTMWITTGLGVKYKNFNFSYAFLPQGDLGYSHQFSLKYTFKFTKKEEFFKEIEKIKEDVKVDEEAAKKPAEDKKEKKKEEKKDKKAFIKELEILKEEIKKEDK